MDFNGDVFNTLKALDINDRDIQYKSVVIESLNRINKSLDGIYHLLNLQMEMSEVD